MAIAFPGFWLGLWQYGVLAVIWFLLVRPSAMFLAPWEITAEALAAFVVGMLVGIFVVAVLLVDGALYALTVPTSWVRRVVAVIASAGLGGLAFVVIYGCGLSYGANTNVPSIQRWTWVCIYSLSVLVLIIGHVYAIWAYRTGR